MTCKGCGAPPEPVCSYCGRTDGIVPRTSDFDRLQNELIYPGKRFYVEDQMMNDTRQRDMNQMVNMYEQRTACYMQNLGLAGLR